MPAKLYKLMFDISISYTIGAFLLMYVGGITLHSGSFLILLITALISILPIQKRKLQTVASILFPVVALAFVRPAIPELIVFLLIGAYGVYVVTTERFISIRGEFVDMLKRFLYLLLLLPFPMITSFHKFSTSVQGASPYLITAMVSAVFLLRYLRTDHQMEQMKRYRRQQLIELLAFLVSCLLLTFAKAPQNLAEGLKLLYQHLLVPILSFVGGIVGMLFAGIIYLVLAVVSFLTKDKELQRVNRNQGKTIGKITDDVTTKVTNTDWAAPLLYSIGAIIVMVLLFFFFRWLMGEKLKQKTSTGIMETREYLEDAKGKRMAFRKRRPKEAREAVRYYYGKCLIWLQHKKVEIKPQDTTEEIDDKYIDLQSEHVKVNREASVQLKQIYRKARYQMTEQVTQEEAEKAKKMYQTIKNA